jgi:hypothetical protein
VIKNKNDENSVYHINIGDIYGQEYKKISEENDFYLFLNDKELSKEDLFIDIIDLQSNNQIISNNCKLYRILDLIPFEYFYYKVPYWKNLNDIKNNERYFIP